MAIMSNNEQEFWNSIPPGYRFEPLDEELITHYLLRKVNNQSLPPNKMHEVELYGKLGPEELTRFYVAEGERMWYFFTRLERLYDNGCRPRRSAGNGYWRMTGRDIEIMNGGQTIGYKRSLAFHVGKHSNGVKTPWLMQEFRLDVPQSKPKPKNKRKRDDHQDTSSSPTSALHSGGSKPKNMLDGWVLCKVYRLGREVPVAQEEHQQQQQRKQQEAALPPPNPLNPSTTTTTIPSNNHCNYINDGGLYQPSLLPTATPSINQYNHTSRLPEIEDLPYDIEDLLSTNDLQQQQQPLPISNDDQALNSSFQEEIEMHRLPDDCLDWLVSYMCEPSETCSTVENQTEKTTTLDPSQFLTIEEMESLLK